MATRAIAWLEERKVPFAVVAYEHTEKGARFAARATGYPLRCTVKTLVAAAAAGHCLALVPGDRQLDLKRLAAALGAKRAAMADTRTAERLTGYLVGGISPFGTRRPLPVLLERAVLDCPQVLINAGRRGLMLKMTPADLQAALGCRAADISRP